MTPRNLSHAQLTYFNEACWMLMLIILGFELGGETQRDYTSRLLRETAVRSNYIFGG
jgi:hypothetical protein